MLYFYLELKMESKRRINNQSIFCQDVLKIAPWLLGKYLVRQFDDGRVVRLKITETEAYNGVDDLACHASKGMTERNKVMFQQGGLVYMYLIYGMYWMLNIVTGEETNPQAVLIRGIEGYNGPGKLTRHLQLDKSFYGEDLTTSERLWIEESDEEVSYLKTPRIGIDYAIDPWKTIEWRFVLQQ